MLSSRRSFLGLAAASAALVANLPSFARQDDDTPPLPDSLPGVLPHSDPDPRVVLEADQKTIKKDVGRLSEIVRDMQKRLDQSDTKEILPVDVLRDTDEIERLARHIRSLVRG